MKCAHTPQYSPYTYAFSANTCHKWSKSTSHETCVIHHIISVGNILSTLWATDTELVSRLSTLICAWKIKEQALHTWHKVPACGGCHFEVTGGLWWRWQAEQWSTDIRTYGTDHNTLYPQNTTEVPTETGYNPAAMPASKQSHSLVTEVNHVVQWLTSPPKPATHPKWGRVQALLRVAAYTQEINAPSTPFLSSPSPPWPLLPPQWGSASPSPYLVGPFLSRKTNKLHKRLRVRCTPKVL